MLKLVVKILRLCFGRWTCFKSWLVRPSVSSWNQRVWHSHVEPPMDGDFLVYRISTIKSKWIRWSSMLLNDVFIWILFCWLKKSSQSQTKTSEENSQNFGQLPKSGKKKHPAAEEIEAMYTSEATAANFWGAMSSLKQDAEETKMKQHRYDYEKCQWSKLKNSSNFLEYKEPKKFSDLNKKWNNMRISKIKMYETNIPNKNDDEFWT